MSNVAEVIDAPAEQTFRTVADATPFAYLGPVWIVEEASGHLRTQHSAKQKPVLRLYKLDRETLHSVEETAIERDSSRAELVAGLLKRANARSGVVLCSFRTVATSKLLAVLEPQIQYVLEIDPGLSVEFQRARDGFVARNPRERLDSASWAPASLQGAGGEAECFAANLGEATINDVSGLRCFAVSFGGIDSYMRGVMVGATSLSLQDVGLNRLAQLLAWVRWIRLAVRRHKRTGATGADNSAQSKRIELLTGTTLKVRANRRIANNLDLKAAQQSSSQGEGEPTFKHKLLAGGRSTLNVVELFAGAGGMGLGFLSAKGAGLSQPYAITASAEIHPIYTHTLRHNHEYMVKNRLCTADAVPAETIPIDLCRSELRTGLSDVARRRGEVDILIGGPPCQGFSSANRNSWSSSNPNNRLVDAFLDCVSILAPRVLLMENVQGILWTPCEEEGSQLSVASHVLQRLQAMGYLVFPKLLDAVWYGVPQNRNRFFLMGIHRDLGYQTDSFGQWGPFPKPTYGPGTGRAFVTVRDAISDLPRIGNGESRDTIDYLASSQTLGQNPFLAAMRRGAPADVIWDHVTSRHAEYVIERYKAIPQGGNWEDVRELMTNYADVSRTHSNIYRRLAMSEPAITIGHYRKSMIVHPTQSRGLSLREAARLQSFPDWFRFAGSSSGTDGGLMHKQQQLANAVCPNVTKAVAEYILQL